MCSLVCPRVRSKMRLNRLHHNLIMSNIVCILPILHHLGRILPDISKIETFSSCFFLCKEPKRLQFSCHPLVRLLLHLIFFGRIRTYIIFLSFSIRYFQLFTRVIRGSFIPETSKLSSDTTFSGTTSTCFFNFLYFEVFDFILTLKIFKDLIFNKTN